MNEYLIIITSSVDLICIGFSTIFTHLLPTNCVTIFSSKFRMLCVCVFCMYLQDVCLYQKKNFVIFFHHVTP